MSPAFTTRRRAEQFDALVEQRSAPDSRTPAELVELLTVAAALREAPAAQPSPEFSADLRARLMAAAPEAMTSGAVADRLTVHTSRPGRSRRERRLGVALGAFALVGATGATAVASEGALPGDTLYPIKRIVEDVRANVSFDDDAKARQLLGQADTRLDEVAQLAARGSDQSAGIRSALEDYANQASQASDLLLSRYERDGDAASVDQVRSFAQDGIAHLDRLASALPESVDEALATAVQTLFDIDRAAAELCPACSDSGITEVPSALVDLVSDSLGGKVDSAIGLGTLLGPPATDATGAGKAGRPSATPSSDQTGSASPSPSPGGLLGLPKPGQSPKPSPKPTSVGGVVGGVTDGVGGVVGGVGDAVGGDAGEVIGGVGDAVGGVGDGLGDTVDGVTGGLLGGLTGTQTPDATAPRTVTPSTEAPSSQLPSTDTPSGN